MTEVPKIVYDRLHGASERTAHERAHPEADLLAAFAEQALSTAEREGVLEHMALCGDCREVVALALPSADVEAPSATGSQNVRLSVPASARGAKGWLSSGKFASPGMRWAAVVAGVAVVASVLLVHPGKLNQATLPSVRQPGPPTPSPASDAQIAPSPMNQRPVLAETQHTAAKSGQDATRPPETQSGMLLAGNKKQPAHRDKLAGSPATGAQIFDYPTVSTANSELAQAPSPAGTLVARNEAPAVEKAKPAPQVIEAEASAQQDGAPTVSSERVKAQALNRNRNTMAAQGASTLGEGLTRNVTWTIAAGVLQRSLDNGQTWQNALHADHLLLCYASLGQDVWAGGEAGTLFHSTDGGATWVQIQPSINSQRLTSDISHIDLPMPSKIVVSTTNNETWSSADSGNIWDKK